MTAPGLLPSTSATWSTVRSPSIRSSTTSRLVGDEPGAQLVPPARSAIDAQRLVVLGVAARPARGDVGRGFVERLRVGSPEPPAPLVLESPVGDHEDPRAEVRLGPRERRDVAEHGEEHLAREVVDVAGALQAQVARDGGRQPAVAAGPTPTVAPPGPPPAARRIRTSRPQPDARPAIARPPYRRDRRHAGASRSGTTAAAVREPVGMQPAAQARSRGPLGPAELAEAVVLADLSLALTVVGQVVPFGGALLMAAVVPLAVVGSRHRLRAVITGAIAAAAVGFLVIGTAAFTTMAACAALGAVVGAADRREWSRSRTMFVGITVLWPLAAVLVDVSLWVFADLRKLTLEQIRNGWKGLFHLFRDSILHCFHRKEIISMHSFPSYFEQLTETLLMTYGASSTLTRQRSFSISIR